MKKFPLLVFVVLLLVAFSAPLGAMMRSEGKSDEGKGERRDSGKETDLFTKQSQERALYEESNSLPSGTEAREEGFLRSENEEKIIVTEPSSLEKPEPLSPEAEDLFNPNVLKEKIEGVKEALRFLEETPNEIIQEEDAEFWREEGRKYEEALSRATQAQGNEIFEDTFLNEEDFAQLAKLVKLTRGLLKEIEDRFWDKPPNVSRNLNPLFDREALNLQKRELLLHEELGLQKQYSGSSEGSGPMEERKRSSSHPYSNFKEASKEASKVERLPLSYEATSPPDPTFWKEWEERGKRVEAIKRERQEKEKEIERVIKKQEEELKRLEQAAAIADELSLLELEKELEKASFELQKESNQVKSKLPPSHRLLKNQNDKQTQYNQGKYELQQRQERQRTQAQEKPVKQISLSYYQGTSVEKAYKEVVQLHKDLSDIIPIGQKLGQQFDEVKNKFFKYLSGSKGRRQERLNDINAKYATTTDNLNAAKWRLAKEITQEKRRLAEEITQKKEKLAEEMKQAEQKARKWEGFSEEERRAFKKFTYSTLLRWQNTFLGATLLELKRFDQDRMGVVHTAQGPVLSRDRGKLEEQKNRTLKELTSSTQKELQINEVIPSEIAGTWRKNEPFINIAQEGHKMSEEELHQTVRIGRPAETVPVLQKDMERYVEGNINHYLYSIGEKLFKKIRDEVFYSDITTAQTLYTTLVNIGHPLVEALHLASLPTSELETELDRLNSLSKEERRFEAIGVREPELTEEKIFADAPGIYQRYEEKKERAIYECKEKEREADRLRKEEEAKEWERKLAERRKQESLYPNYYGPTSSLGPKPKYQVNAHFGSTWTLQPTATGGYQSVQVQTVYYY